MLELDGTVLESLPNAMFRVQLMDSEQARMRARTGTVARTHAPTHAAWRSGWHTPGWRTLHYTTLHPLILRCDRARPTLGAADP